MKQFLPLPLLLVALAGCNASSAQNGDATAPSAAPVPDAAPAASTSTAGTKPAAESSAPAAKTYRVVPAGGPPGSEKYRLAPPPLSTKIPDHPRVVMLTTRGPITLELDAKAAPLHVRSMLYLASKGFYNGIKFHRYADLLGNGQGFIIQGGDPLTKDPATESQAGNGGPGYEIPREYNSLKHDKLVIAAARTNDPDSAGSQFYITQNPVPFLDEGDGYTVFGRVVSGEKAALALRQDDVIKSVTLQK